MICTPAWRANSGMDLPASSAGISMGLACAHAALAQTSAIQAAPQCSADFEKFQFINPPNILYASRHGFACHGLAGVDERNFKFPIVFPLAPIILRGAARLRGCS